MWYTFYCEKENISDKPTQTGRTPVTKTYRHYPPKNNKCNFKKGLSVMSDYRNQDFDENEDFSQNETETGGVYEDIAEEKTDEVYDSEPAVPEESREPYTSAETEPQESADLKGSEDPQENIPDENVSFVNRKSEPSKSVFEEKGAAVLKPAENKKSGAFFKKLAATAAGIAVVGAFVGTGLGMGSYIYKNGGVYAANGSDINLAADGEKSVSPIVYTTNYKSISEVFNSVENAVVNIRMTVNTTNIWNQVYEATGSGSGIIYKVDGDNVYIVTNNHVVDGAKSVSVSVTGEEQLFASLVGKDAENDLAVIKVSKDAFASAGITDVKPAEFVRDDSEEIGETVLAIGNALGRGKTVTMGIVSAKNKNISIDGNNLTVIQTDAAINPGNSGGALINLDGKVIGINTAKTGSQVIEGTGYAIPSYSAVKIFDQIIEKGTVEKPYLGVICFTINDTFRHMYNLDVSGVFVQEITSGSAAEKAGLRATDIITAVNGKQITSQQDLQDTINGLSVGDSIKIDFLRNGREAMSVNAVLENYNEF